LSDEKEDEPVLDETKKLIPPTPKEVRPVRLLLASTLPKSPMRRIMRDDVAEALAYGARPIPRSDAVAALQALGFQKTAAYKALSEDGRFGELIEHSQDGLVEWKG